MARIAFAWELGGELGHAMACATLARALAARGHERVFILRELHQLDALPALDGSPVYQAPVTPREGHGFGIPASWPDILLGCGYANPDDLTGLLAGWLELLQHAKPDLLVADYAPTALLAARVLGLKRVSYSNGFAVPPKVTPMPPFRVDVPVDVAAVGAREAHALANVNAALERTGAAPLGALQEQFDTDEDFLCTFPELDHYGNRPVSRFWGPRFTVDAGENVRWPYGAGPRVAVYLRPSVPHLDLLIDLLVAHRCRVAAYIPRLDDARRTRLQSAQRRVCSRPMRLGPLLEECDLFVNHGGNVAAAAVMHGVPQLILPTQYEQFMTAVRIEQLGAGVGLGTARKPDDVRTAFLRVIRDNARFKAAAQAFRKRYPAFSPAEQERRVVARIEQILADGVAT